MSDVSMYEKRYFEVIGVLDQAHGTEESDGAGEGIVQDVHLLMVQRDDARNIAVALEQENARLIEALSEIHYGHQDSNFYPRDIAGAALAAVTS